MYFHFEKELFYDFLLLTTYPASAEGGIMFVYSLISHLPIYLCSQEMLAFNLCNIKILSPKFKDRVGEKKYVRPSVVSGRE